MSSWFQLSLQFILSGAVVVGATLLSKQIDSKWAGLLVALPIMTVLGFVFISLDSPNIAIQRYLISALVFMVPAAIYILSLYLLSSRISLVPNVLLSLLPLAIAVFFIQRLL